MNILDYLDWRGDLLLSDRPFNEVDNLILCSLAYLDLDGIVSSDGDTMDFPAILAKYNELGREQPELINNPRPLLEKIVQTDRFRPVRIGRYVSQTDPEKGIQFAAMTFYLDDGTVYIAFRGTDDTLVGWREDFNFALSDETPGQTEAVEYLNAVATTTDARLRVGGHSKGGNFAVYASLYCDPAVRERILIVYSNDGPGFVHSIAESDEYKEMMPRIRKIIPENSLIGILLTGYEKKHVIKSNAKGLMQHNPFTWETLKARFDPADERSPLSLFMDETLSRWLDGLSYEQKSSLVSAIFDSMEASGATTLSAVTENLSDLKGTIFNALKEMDKETTDAAKESVGKLFSTGGGVIADGLKGQFGFIGKVFRKETDEVPVAMLPEGDPAPESTEN